MASKKKTAIKTLAGIAVVEPSSEPESLRNAGPRPLPEHHEIARLAFRIYESRGWQHGYDVEDWLRAEQEIVGQ